jgi:hypothetical protein
LDLHPWHWLFCPQIDNDAAARAGAPTVVFLVQPTAWPVDKRLIEQQAQI